MQGFKNLCKINLKSAAGICILPSFLFFIYKMALNHPVISLPIVFIVVLI